MQNNTELPDQILISIRQIVRRITNHSRFLSRQLGLTIPQLLCLRAIGELESVEEEITINRVSQQVKLSAATVSRIVDRLVRADLVIRERGKRDRRRVCLSLTVMGLERYQTLPAPLQEQFVRRLNALPLEEQSALLASLNQIGEFMDAQDLDAAPILTPGEVIRSGD